MSQNRIVMLATGLAITLLPWDSALQAQAPRRPDGPPGSSLLSNPAVQKELQLTEEQKSKLQKVTSGWNQKLQERLQIIRDSLAEGAAHHDV